MKRLSFLLFVFVALASVKLTVGQSNEEIRNDLIKHHMRCEQKVGSSAALNVIFSLRRFDKTMLEINITKIDQSEGQEQQLCLQFEAIENAGEALLADMSRCLYEESSVIMAAAKRALIVYQRYARFFCRDQLVVRGETSCLKQKNGEFAKCNYFDPSQGHFGPIRAIGYLQLEADPLSRLADCSDQKAECMLEKLRTALDCGDGVRQLMSAELKKALDACPTPALIIL